jgi:hypothetical protein
VLKPAVSLAALDTGRYQLGDPQQRRLAVEHLRRLQATGRMVMAQPYLRAVDTDGETALVYLCGRFSHAMRKGRCWTAPNRCRPAVPARRRAGPANPPAKRGAAGGRRPGAGCGAGRPQPAAVCPRRPGPWLRRPAAADGVGADRAAAVPRPCAWRGRPAGRRHHHVDTPASPITARPLQASIRGPRSSRARTNTASSVDS